MDQYQKKKVWLSGPKVPPTALYYFQGSVEWNKPLKPLTFKHCLLHLQYNPLSCLQTNNSQHVFVSLPWQCTIGSHCLLPGSDITLLSPSRGLLFILFIHIYPFYPNLSYLLEINNSLHIRPVDCCLLCCYRSAVQQQLFLIFRQTNSVSGPPPLCQLQKHFFTINKQKSKWMTSESPNFHWRGTGGNSLSGMSISIS